MGDKSAAPRPDRQQSDQQQHVYFERQQRQATDQYAGQRADQRPKNILFDHSCLGCQSHGGASGQGFLLAGLSDLRVQSSCWGSANWRCCTIECKSWPRSDRQAESPEYCWCWFLQGTPHSANCCARSNQ